jgi:hypothetical protein
LEEGANRKQSRRQALNIVTTRRRIRLPNANYIAGLYPWAHDLSAESGP